MFKRSKIYQSMLLALVLPGVAAAEVEISGYLKNETAVFTRDGQVTGEADTMLDEDGHESGDLMKFENSARFFLNGYFGESSSWHADLNFIYDSEGATDDYKGHRLYTQNDYLRELYVDTTLSDWSLRLGKQQVVWGTADGIKLLDIINPTDYRELNQNSMEDSRIPIWMINAERNIGDRSNIQFIVSQVEENKIPGLTDEDESGQPFMMKGVETISGNVNGFFHVAPKLSNVAATFNAAAFGGLLGGTPSPIGLNAFAGLTVDGFASGAWDITALQTATPFIAPGAGAPSTTDPFNFAGYLLLNQFAQFGFTGFTTPFDPNGNFAETNLLPVTGLNPTLLGAPGYDPTVTSWDPVNASSAFELMPLATFATFNTFTQFTSPSTLTGMQSEWVKDYPDDADVNAGFRFRNTLDNGLNWSLNYFYHYSANPDINLSYVDSSGNELTVQRAPTSLVPGTFGVPDTSVSLSRDEARANWDLGNPTTILVHDDAGNYYGAITPSGTPGMGAPTLRFTESLHRVNSLGTSFDYGTTLFDIPLVLRGEFLYDRNDKQPVVDKYLLAIGDLTNSLKMEDADYFKYVLGADITVATNLLVSGQFIQYRNLDFIDEKDSCATFSGSVDCSRYTADFPTLSMGNGLQKGYENKEFYSLFLSKPFGPSQEHRWNNIFIYEEGGGKWNRLDVEYSFTDTLIGSAEWNNYWGDENSTFGQFENSSNVQVGMKWLFQ